MGSGKTTAIYNAMRENKNRRYIYTTPLLSEVKRTTDSVPGFYEPLPYGRSKLDSLHRLMEEGRNIATTHALMLLFDDETLRLAREKGYSLVIDETTPVLSEYNNFVKQLDGKTVDAETTKWLLNEGMLTVDPHTLTAEWNASEEQGFAYSEVVRFSDMGQLRCVNNTLYRKQPPELFDAFEDVTVLTFMFDGSILKPYLDMHGFKYELLEVAHDGHGNYEFVPYVERDARLEQFAPLITIYEGKYNKIGARPNALSVTDLGRTGRLREAHLAMRSCKQAYGIKNNSLMWTTSMRDGYHLELQKDGFKYTHKLTAAELALSEEEMDKLSTFVPCTARATNDFRDRTNLMYMLNRYIQAGIAQYFRHRDYPIDEDRFAIAELVQWIWRSAIRDGNPIWIYIPSSRMRKLLYRELGIGSTLFEVHARELQKTA